MTIERVIVDGRPGSGCYIDDKFRPVPAARATLLKIVFDDGDQLILSTSDEPHDEARNAAKNGPASPGSIKDNLPDEPASHTLARGGFDPSEPRDEHGQWTEGGGDGGGEAAGGGSGATGGREADSLGAKLTGLGHAGLSDAYARESPGASAGGRDVTAVHSLSAEGRAGWHKAGWTPLTFHELKSSGAERFHAAIAAGKANPHGAAVELHPVEDYRGMRLFLTPDEKVGFALKGDNIVSLFKHPDAKVKGAAASALALAVQAGGRRLDAFDTTLPHLYSRMGFQAVGRLAFSDQFAPPGWNHATYADFNGGRPDIVFMTYDPAYGQAYQKGDGQRVADYDAGVAAQDAALGTKQPSAGEAKPEPSSASALVKPVTATVDEIVASVPTSKERVAATRVKLAQSVPTDAPVAQGGHKLPDGSWTPERAAVHRDIVSRILTPEAITKATPKQGEQPTLHLLGGRGGSGKSWFTGPKGTIDKSRSLYLNNDDIKEKLPEWQGWNAAMLHEESSQIGTAVENAARDAGLNVIIDGTMRSGKSLNDRVASYRAAGYRIEGHYMYTSPENATKRALERFVRGGETGRFVPPDYSLSSTTNEANFDSIRPKVDAWEIYDNDGSAPKFHARG